MEPLSIPPPIWGAYPWYSLFDEGIAHNVDLCVDDGGGLRIQWYQGQWSVVTKVSDDEYIVSWTGETSFRATQPPGSPPSSHFTRGSWTLELIRGPIG